MEKYRVVIAGCGNISREWIEYADKRENVRIAALVDIRREAAETMKERYNLDCPVFTDLQEAIRAVKANLVFDVTIPESHLSVLKTALEEGCDVFGEKPMAASIAEARQMVELAEASGRTYAVMQNRRYTKEMMAFRELVQSGTIGDVGFVNADFFMGLHNGGYRHTMDHPLLMDLAVHTFDQSRFITGKDPVAVYCQEFSPPGAWFAGEAAAICIFEYEGGSVFCFRGYYNAEGAHTSWESTWRIVGSKGTAIWDGQAAPYAELPVEPEGIYFQKKSSKITADLVYSGRERHQGCLDEMFEALEAGRKPATVCTDNVISVGMALGAIQSSREGVKIKL